MEIQRCLPTEGLKDKFGRWQRWREFPEGLWATETLLRVVPLSPGTAGAQGKGREPCRCERPGRVLEKMEKAR